VIAAGRTLAPNDLPHRTGVRCQWANRVRCRGHTFSRYFFFAG